MAAGKQMRVALIGAGFIADVHLRVLARLDGVKTVALCDPARARAVPIRSHFAQYPGEALASLAERDESPVERMARLAALGQHGRTPADRRQHLPAPGERSPLSPYWGRDRRRLRPRDPV